MRAFRMPARRKGVSKVGTSLRGAEAQKCMQLYRKMTNVDGKKARETEMI